MHLPVLLVIALTLIIEIRGQNSTAKVCQASKGGNDADTCLMHLLLVGDPKYVFPETKAQMSSHCKLISKYEKCIKDYSSKCLSSFSKQVTSVLAYGVAKTNRGYCSNRRRKDQFIAMGKCANSIKADADVCMANYIEALQGTENHKDINVKIPLACCNFYKFKSCMMKSTEKHPKQICSESNKEEIERIIDGYAFDVLQLICGEYTDDSDKCQTVLPKNAKTIAVSEETQIIVTAIHQHFGFSSGTIRQFQF